MELEFLSVGFVGQGALTVEDGGLVQVRRRTILGPGNSEATVTGSHGQTTETFMRSELNTANLLLHGGTLTIAEGARVDSTTATIGDTADAEVIVSGTGPLSTQSQWDVDHLHIGPSGTVRLAASSGRVNVGDLIPGLASGEVGVGRNGLLSGSGTIVGNLRLAGGTSMFTGGIVAPANSPGMLTIEGDIMQEEHTRLLLEVAGTEAIAQHDVLKVAGNATIEGVVELAFIDGFAPQAGQTFEFLQVGGAFMGPASEQIRVSGLLAGFEYETSFADGLLRLVALNDGAAGLRGDYNASGQVEQADLDLVLLNWGQPAFVPPPGWSSDLPQGSIDQAELDRVLLNWGGIRRPMYL